MNLKTFAIATLTISASSAAVLAQDKSVDRGAAGPTQSMDSQVPAMAPPPGAGAGKDMTAANCEQAELASLMEKAGSMSDKDKQRMTMGHLNLAQKSLNMKDVDGCAMHMKEASAGMGDLTKN